MAKRGNGEGSIYYSEKLNRWIGQYTYNGKRKSLYGKTRAEVKNKLNKELVNIVDNKYVDRSNFTLSNIISMIIDEQYKSNKISDTTYRRKKETAKIIESELIYHYPIQKIDASMINEFLLSISHYSNSVITKVAQLIRNAFDKALILNIVLNNPFNIKGLINVPKSSKKDKEVEALTIDEQKLFIKELEKGYDEYTNIFFTAIYTGMRIGEILALSPNNIDLKNKIIHIDRTLTKDVNDRYIIGKTTKTYAGTRDIPITSLIEDVFSEVKNCNGDIFFTYNNKIISPNTINTHFKKICKNAHINETIIPKKKQTKKRNRNNKFKI